VVPSPPASRSPKRKSASAVKGVGDFVKADEALVELETDKAAQEVPAPVSGTIVEIVAEQGANVEVGALLARIREGSQGEAAEAPAPAKAKAEPQSPPAGGSLHVPASPSAAKMLAENRMSPDQVDGSGKRGQVLKGDVIEALEKGVTPQKAAAPAAAPRGPSSGDDAAREERVKMTVCARPSRGA
jgi:2-oxoglutarate dehydrogenase E2 component (dihydrolipoamide succinyltransferase)